jgi:hypothetical protein
MKIYLAVILCLIFGFNVEGQTNSNENKEVVVEEISLAKDDGKGNVSEATNSFTTTDVPIHCFVGLNSTRSVTVKMIFVAVKSETLRPETKVVTVSYKTNGKQDGVNFNASPETTWAAGAYRVDVFIDGKLSKSLEFEIKKSAKEVVKEKPVPPKSKDKPQAKQKSRKT